MLFSVVFYHFFCIFCCFLSFFLYFLFLSFFLREMVFSKVIDEIALFCRSFVLSHSSAKVSAGFTNVSGPAPCLSSKLFLFLTFVSSTA